MLILTSILLLKYTTQGSSDKFFFLKNFAKRKNLLQNVNIFIGITMSDNLIPLFNKAATTGFING